MKKKISMVLLGFLLISSMGLAQDISIDGNGNITTGTSNSYGNVKVIGASGEHGVVGEARGTGTAGIYGKNTDTNNYGILGNDNYGVYGNSSSGYAGYFEGNVTITGDLNIVGSMYGESDPTVKANVKDGVDWTELTGIPAGFADGIDDTTDSSIWLQSDSNVYYNGNVGIGTSAPAGKLDVNGDICLGNVCRTTWPSGSGAGAFTDTGTSAYYTGGSVGIGTTNPMSLGSTDTRVLHIRQSLASLDNAAAGVRLEVDGYINGGITSAYNSVTGDGGVFIGALSNHRLGFITNSMERMSLASNGYLGIGTMSPLQHLHVQGSAYISENIGVRVDSPTHALQINGTDALLYSGTGDFRLYLSKNLSSGYSSLVFQDNFLSYAEVGLLNDNDFHIKVSPDGLTFSDAMVIDHTNGNIGVNTRFPYAKVHALSLDENIAIQAENLGTGNSIYAWKEGSGDAVYVRKKGIGDGIVLHQQGDGRPLVIKSSLTDIVFVVEKTGRTGIGTATPQSELQVNGYAQLAILSGPPPSEDCDNVLERGRMKVDSAAGLLYICMDSGWVAK